MLAIEFVFSRGDFFWMWSWENFILPFSSAPSTSAPFHSQAIENENQNHLMNKVQKLANERKYTLFRLFFRLSLFNIPYDPRLWTYKDEYILFLQGF